MIIHGKQGGELLRRLQRAAYETVADEWNGSAAARKLLDFCSKLAANEKYIPPENGPMSVAHIIKAPGFIRALQEDNHLE